MHSITSCILDMLHFNALFLMHPKGPLHVDAFAT